MTCRPVRTSPLPSTSAPAKVTCDDKKTFIEIQCSLRKKLITYDDFKWKVPSTAEQEETTSLKYVGGVDVSYSKEDPSVACGTIVVLDVHTLNVVYQDYSIFTPQYLYKAGFLAFREVPILKDLLDKMKSERRSVFPQIVMIDGNGILHPQGFGSASHLGVEVDVPTIGVAKELHYVKGLNVKAVRKLLKSRGNISKDFCNLKGRFGRIWGAAMWPTKPEQRPIFISIGHRVSLETAIQVVSMTCKYLEPEPIRQADLISREHIQKHDLSLRSSASFSGPNKGQRGGDGASRFELNGIVDDMGRINMNNENRPSYHYSSSSHGHGQNRRGQNRRGMQSGSMGSVQYGRGSFSRARHWENGARFVWRKKAFKEGLP